MTVAVIRILTLFHKYVYVDVDREVSPHHETTSTYHTDTATSAARRSHFRFVPFVADDYFSLIESRTFLLHTVSGDRASALPETHGSAFLDGFSSISNSFLYHTNLCFIYQKEECLSH